MRSKLSDQDLTDYALDELGPEERLYVESMLAVSEECRNDVYETIDMAMSIEEGFEREEGKAELIELTMEQRAALLNVRMPNRFLHRTVAGLAAVAAIALALVSKDAWMPKMPSMSGFHMARVSHEMVSTGAQAVSTAEPEDFVNPLASFRKLMQEPAKWLPSQSPAGSTVFGPPSSMNIEVAPRSGLEFSE